MAQQRNQLLSKKPTQAQAKTKSRLLLVFYCLLFVGVIVGAVLLCIFMFFKVAKVNINTTTVYSGQEIVEATGIKSGNNLVFLNTEAAQQAVLSKFPYIENLQIKKKLPTTVEIQVTEAVVAYTVEQGGGYVYVSQKGKILEQVSTPFAGSVLVKAGEVGEKDGYLSLATAELQAIFDKILTMFGGRGVEKITQMDISNIHALSLLYDNRIVFLLGNAVDLTAKIDFGLKMLDRGDITQEEQGTLDLSHAISANRAYFSAAVQSTPVPPAVDTPEGDTPEGDTPAVDTPQTDTLPEADTPTPEPTIESTRGQDIPDV